ncbi:Oidioi.mRNA.OKI2018_I69.YSR.g17168.t1.cds [Oikopleura dioica]|uniref:Oidioi.mRNA.OKI2018_I69.YSR.g17168.t1.cds n=1 Tax=Oikopleura dioica TaxID=34765 RepID=A0ABN7SQL8_OIKDI|nr:Oidioi.mRNA.OKI2018_I69.YSR.g17168.t1.cds [Oikopleura dioica]
MSQLDQVRMPFPEEIQTFEKNIGQHNNAGQCDCAEKLKAKKIKRVIEKFNSELDPYSDDEVNIKATDIKTTAANGTDLKWWRPHDIIEDMVKTEEIEGQENFAEDEKMIYFFRENKLDPKERLKPRNFLMESVFCDPKTDAERPISTGRDGECVIPFYYPKFTRKTLGTGMSEYDIELSAGPVPKMIIFTGMPYSQASQMTFEKCISKTTMEHPFFKIQEFTIYIDGQPAYRSPWSTATQHYINFMKHNGRWENAATASGLDYFVFKGQNWLVPLIFDNDGEGQTALVTAKIKFADTLVQQWDAMIMRLPVRELFLDAKAREASVVGGTRVMKTTARGTKRRAETIPPPPKAAPKRRRRG